MNKQVKEWVKALTLEEKASLTSGKDFWHMKGIERLNIPELLITDGPHGVRKQVAGTDHLGLNDSEPATCFPAASALASSWDPALLEKVGRALGEECQTQGVSVLLGPGANIKRSPLCGRNFEYFSEDPYLSKTLAKAHVNGVQSQGIGTSLKHFVANNQEHRRMSVNAEIDERALREIYLASFEDVVREAQPWTVMSAYNKINGTYASENNWLLQNVLRDEWGFEGIVVSDWGAVDERVPALSAGLDLEMPPNNGISDRKIVDAVNRGELSEAQLDKVVERILTLILKVVNNNKSFDYDKQAHHQLAREVAGECVVLLKNEDQILPINKNDDLLVVGAFAKQPRYQGGGSSHINPTFLDNGLEEMNKMKSTSAEIEYIDGYDIDEDEINNQLIEKVVKKAQKYKKVIIYAGLPDHYESEGFDRQHLKLPKNQDALIAAIAKTNPNVVIVLSNGAPIEMPWVNDVKGIVEGYLGGQAVGGAIADVLYGEVNPSGKLAETFPMKLEDNPSYLSFPGERDQVVYNEGVFVGYRYYDAKKLKPLFPFGHGLSYTDFEYSNLVVEKKNITAGDLLNVSVTVKNIGNRKGKEVVQLYVHDKESTFVRPMKELKGFQKVELKAGEERQVHFELDERSFSYYDTQLNDWHVEEGEFEILVGRSATNIILNQSVWVNSNKDVNITYTRNTPIGDLLSDPEVKETAEAFLGQLSQGMNADQEPTTNKEMVEAMMRYTPLRSLIAFSDGMFTDEMLDGFLQQLNSVRQK